MSTWVRWTEEEDQILTSLSGTQVTPELIERRLPGRTRFACNKRCVMLGIPRPRWPRGRIEAIKHPLEPVVLRMFRAAADAGAPCPRVTQIEEVVKVSPTKITGITRALIDAGAFRLEYHGNSRRKVIFPDGVESDWSLVGEPVETTHAQVARQRWETDEARAIFAGVRFDDAPVRRDLRRFTRPATRVLTGVTGAWA